MHIDTDEIRWAAILFRWNSDEMRQQIEALTVRARQLDWTGLDRDIFLNEFESTAYRIYDAANYLEEFSSRLDRTASRWESVANMGMD